MSLIYICLHFQLAGADDISLLKSDRLWRYDDQFDDVAKQAFHNVLYVSEAHYVLPIRPI